MKSISEKLEALEGKTISSVVVGSQSDGSLHYVEIYTTEGHSVELTWWADYMNEKGGLTAWCNY